MGWSGLSVAAKAFIIAHTAVVVLVILAALAFLAADDPLVRRWLNRRRLPVLKVASASSAENPFLCSMPDCRRHGEIFWQTRSGVLMLCRTHAQHMRKKLDQYLETPEHE